MTTKMITWNCTYKIKLKDKKVDLNAAANELSNNILNLLNKDEFDEHMSIIAKELTIETEKVNNNEVEFIVMMFATMLHVQESPNKLFRKYMENNLLKIESEKLTARIIKRRIY